MLPGDLRSLALLLGPLLLIGFVAGGLRAFSLRPDLPAGRRRTFQAAWIILLLAGGPLWLVLAAMLRIW